MPDLMKSWEEHADTIRKVIGVAAFVYAADRKDIGSNFGSLSTSNKAKILVNQLVLRISGIGPVWPYSTGDAVPPPATQTINIGGVINPVSISGGILWVAAEVGFIPSKYARWGKTILTAGVFGGIFDDPIPTVFQNPVPGIPYGATFGVNAGAGALPNYSQDVNNYISSLA